jgi:hypothetical protein
MYKDGHKHAHIHTRAHVHTRSFLGVAERIELPDDLRPPLDAGQIDSAPVFGEAP